jgi:hypothetical protein
MIAPAADNGLEIGNTVIHVNPNGGIFVHGPSVIPWGSTVTVDGPVNNGLFELSDQSPNAVPVLEHPYGSLVSDGSSSNTQAHQITSMICLYEAGQAGVAQSAQLVDCSAPVTSPQFPTSNAYDWEMLSPGPPYIYQPYVDSTYYFQGARVSDTNSPENIWVATTPGTSAQSSFAPTCSTVGSGATTFPDGLSGLVWTCIRKGTTWATGQSYALGTVLTSGGIDYEVITKGAGNTSTSPTFNSNFGGCDTTTTGCGAMLADGYQYQAISMSSRPNLLVGPAYQLFGEDCGTASNCGTLGSPIQIVGAPAASYMALYSALQYQWSGCSGNTAILPLSRAGTCARTGTGPAVNVAVVNKFTAGTPGNSGLPVISGSHQACTLGFTCNTTTRTYYINFAQATPMGITPLAIGEGTVSATAGQAIVVTAPAAYGSSCTSAPCPAPNATGWVAGLSTISGREVVQVPDGVNAYCGDGNPSRYVPNMQHGAECLMGQSETIVNPQTSPPFFPVMDATKFVFAGGGITPLQSINGNPMTGILIQGYGSALGPGVEEECGPGFNVGEPYTIFYYAANVQEQGGVFHSKASDCMQGYAFYNGVSSQNSSLRTSQVGGQSAGYTYGTLLQDVAGFRLFDDTSASGFQQNGAFVSQFGVAVIGSAQAATSGANGAIIMGIECEITFDCIQLRNARGVSIIGNNGSTSTRGANIFVHEDYLTHDTAIVGMLNNSACPDLKEIVNPVPAAGCSSATAEGAILAGNVSGSSNADATVITTDPTLQSQFYPGFTAGNTEQLSVNSSGNLTTSGTVSAASVSAAASLSNGTTFGASGCSAGTFTGGATAGSYKSGTTGTCTVTVTMGGGASATHGWACSVWDLTTTTDVQKQSTSSTTQVTFSGTTATGDVITFSCVGY